MQWFGVGNKQYFSLSPKEFSLFLVLMAASTCKVGVVFDMQFAGLMHQKDLGKKV
jgi:hypothetical protein